jgi:hypothetical protein
MTGNSIKLAVSPRHAIGGAHPRRESDSAQTHAIYANDV